MAERVRFRDDACRTNPDLSLHLYTFKWQRQDGAMHGVRKRGWCACLTKELDVLIWQPIISNHTDVEESKA